ncbi:hypothetical protein DPMN_162011 [Dreissena polymorpha]|uniref:Uncharacterized protein n=1 Tax=Dreissena polymorpha TaxID=45954 RepID=A0A9D4EPT9_DREPO|nr:hypothetical protein DPMN_162011 [Dreissena polymorpha]
MKGWKNGKRSRYDQLGGRLSDAKAGITSGNKNKNKVRVPSSKLNLRAWRVCINVDPPRLSNNRRGQHLVTNLLVKRDGSDFH